MTHRTQRFMVPKDDPHGSPPFEIRSIIADNTGAVRTLAGGIATVTDALLGLAG